MTEPRFADALARVLLRKGGSDEQAVSGAAWFAIGLAAAMVAPEWARAFHAGFVAEAPEPGPEHTPHEGSCSEDTARQVIDALPIRQVQREE